MIIKLISSFDNKQYFYRFLIQFSQSLTQFATTLIFLKLLSLKDFGFYSLFLVIGTFFCGLGTNSYLYKLSFDIPLNVRPFLSFTYVFSFFEIIFCFIVGYFLDYLFFVLLIVILRNQNIRIQEFINRLTFENDDISILRSSLIIKIIQSFCILIVLIYVIFKGETSLMYFNLFFLVPYALFLYMLEKFASKENISNKTKFKVLISKDTVVSTKSFFIYFFKAQSSGIILSFFTLEGFAIFSACRIMSSPLTIITPVLSSFSFSKIIKHKKKLLNYNYTKILIFGVIFYSFIVLFFSESFFKIFYNEYNDSYLLFSLAHIAIGFIALFRSIEESQLQAFKKLKFIYNVNLFFLPFYIILSLILIYYLNIYGAMITLFISELFILSYYKVKRN